MSRPAKNVVALICVTLFLIIGSKTVEDTYGPNPTRPYSSQVVGSTITEDGQPVKGSR